MNFITLVQRGVDVVFVSVLEIGGHIYIAERSARHESRAAVIEMAAKRNSIQVFERERKRALEDFRRDNEFSNPHEKGTVEHSMYWLATYELAEFGHA